MNSCKGFTSIYVKITIYHLICLTMTHGFERNNTLRACLGCLSSRSRHHSTRSRRASVLQLGRMTILSVYTLRLTLSFLYIISCSQFFKSTLKLPKEHLKASLKLFVIAQVMFVVSRRIRDKNYRCFHTMRFFTKQFCPNVMKDLK